MSFHLVLTFMITATLLTMAPGLDTAVVLRSASSDGSSRGVSTALGIAMGCLCWGTIAAFGLAGLMQRAPLAFDVLKWGGALYLGWIGSKLIVRPRAAMVATHTDPAPGGLLNSARRGFLTNILNPKVGLFYLTLLPQFAGRGSGEGQRAFELAALHVTIATVWFSLLAVAAGGIRPWLRKPCVVPVMDRVTGAVFVLLGIGLLTSSTLHA